MSFDFANTTGAACPVCGGPTYRYPENPEHRRCETCGSDWDEKGREL